MRIATWNINSIRLRIDTVVNFIKKNNVDVICLQETKTEDSSFPINEFSKNGLIYSNIRGQKSYNGVAILSRLPFIEKKNLKLCDNNDARHASVKFENKIILHNFYVPAGGDEPDVEKNDKFAHKLDFIKEAKHWFRANRKKSDRLVLVGDLNIAPLESDVWSHKQLLKVVSHTPVEVLNITQLQEELDWIDTTRHVHPEPEKLFSWWSYRARDWSASDRGRRLDHIWVTSPLKPFITNSSILREARGWEKPSDHVPVTTELQLH